MAKKKKRSKRIKPIRYGITWDSKLELNHYEILKDEPLITVVDRQKTFVLNEGFGYVDFPLMKKRKYRDMKYTPDFMITVKGIDKPIAFESKGFARKDYNIRKKLFIQRYGDEYYFWQVGSVKQLKEEIRTLKGELNNEN